MKQLAKTLILAALLTLPFPFAALAQSGHGPDPAYADKVQRLEQVIQAQQRQLEAQQKQLEEQRQMLQQLQKQVQGLAPANARPARAAAPGKPARAAAAPAPTGQAAQTIPTAMVPPLQHQDKAWPGSFKVEGMKTRFAIGGFAQLDVIHDSNAITDLTEFTTAAIVTRGATKAQGSDGQTNFSVNATRLWFETRTDLDIGLFRTYLSMDFYGNTNTSPKPRLREAYGELSKFVGGGDLMAGQAWSTTAYTPSYPNTLDYEGPNSMLGVRQPQVRWVRALGEGLNLKLAMETPNTHEVGGADSLTLWPDAVGALEWKVGQLQVQGLAMLRDLRASKDNGPTENTLGWGLNGAGVLGLPFLGPQDNITFSVLYGQGIGSLINDAPPDAYYDAANQSLEAVTTWGYYLGLQHGWSENWCSVLVYGYLDVDNLDIQPVDAFHSSQYASVNLMWTPTPNWMLGGELLWGERVDKDGADGNDTRLQLSTRFTF